MRSTARGVGQAVHKFTFTQVGAQAQIMQPTLVGFASLSKETCNHKSTESSITGSVCSGKAGTGIADRAVCQA